MARRFIVHVGAHKTGTSAFQEWAVRNRAALLDAGFLYPRIGATSSGNHASMVSALGGLIRNEKRSQHLLRVFKKELDQHPNAAVILSAELMSTLGFLPHLQQLKQALQPYSDDATVVLVVRDQIEWRNSCYAQARQMLTRMPRFKDYIAIRRRDPRGGNWDYMEQQYREAGFSFATLPFNRQLRDTGIVAALATLPCLAGLAGIDEGERTETNPSVGALSLLVAEQVRSSLDEASGTAPTAIRARLADIIAKHAKDLADSRFNGFDQEMIDVMRADYRHSNEAYAQRNFGTSWEELFPPKAFDYVSCDSLDALDREERREVRTLSGRVVMDALEAGLLQLTPRSPVVPTLNGAD